MTRLYARNGMTRKEFMSRIGADKEVDPLVDLAYKLLNEREFKQSDQGSAAADKWHVSFHGSQFPGNDPHACGRASLYRLMDVPRLIFNRRGRQFMDAGKDFEDRLVWAWYHAGFLVSNPPNMKQTMFEDPEHWLTSTVDAILLKPRDNKPFVAEVKNVGQKYIDNMRNLVSYPMGHEKYIRQIKCQIGLAHEFGPMKVHRCFNTGLVSLRTYDDKGNVDHMCPQHMHSECVKEMELEPVDYGRLYYASRDDPMDTFEFYFDYDPDFMADGRRMLANWRGWFEQDTLPQTNFEDKRYSHPFGWRWSLPEFPCKWCDYGDVCRDDHDVAKETGKHIKLSDSAAVEVAQRFREGWTYDDVKDAVYERWGLASVSPISAKRTRRARTGTSRANAA